MSSEQDQQAAQLIYPQHAQENATVSLSLPTQYSRVTRPSGSRSPDLQTLSNIKFLSSCFVGAVAGILGLTNHYGFALFGFSSLLTAVVVYLVHIAGKGVSVRKKSPTVRSFVRGGVWDIVNPGQENVFSFVLLWTLFYGVSLNNNMFSPTVC